MIFVDLSEGLGNQMFQYAFAKKLQMLYREKICLDTQSFQRNISDRSFSLNNFVLNKDVSYNMGLREHIFDVYAKLYRKYLSRTGKDLYNPLEVVDYERKGFYISRNVFEYVEYNFNCKKRNKYVLGSWMNGNYFSDIRNELVNDFSLKSDLSLETQQMLKQVKETQAICVHIRLGDYLDPKWSYLNVCTADYYKRSIDYLYEKLEHPVFYIFSNTTKDLDWIREKYVFLNQYYCIFVNLSNPDYADLELMKNCKHFVLSNSTYSWWAQYLSQNKEKIVIAPNVWSREKNVESGWKINGKTLGIYQNSWKIIEV